MAKRIINSMETFEKIIAENFQRSRQIEEFLKERQFVEPRQDISSPVFTLEHGTIFADVLLPKIESRFPIPLYDKQKTGYVRGVDSITRAAINTILYMDKDSNFYLPATQEEAESLIRQRNFPPTSLDEDIGLLLFDISEAGANPLHAESLRRSIVDNKDSLGLTKDEIFKRLLVINPGLAEDSGLPFGIKFAILYGVTQVYVPEIINRVYKRSYNKLGFNLASDHGLPNEADFSSYGLRIFYEQLPNPNLGLRVLSRKQNFTLDTTKQELQDPNAGTITFIARNE